MIKANDLRLGNYLQLDGENYHVNEIYNNLQCVELKRKNLENPNLNDYEECDLDCEDLQPIQLTEKWLLKAGFKKIGRLFYHESFWACELSSNNELRFEDLDNLYIKYVHQLQNLYFALCGEELVFSTTEP